MTAVQLSLFDDNAFDLPEQISADDFAQVGKVRGRDNEGENVLAAVDLIMWTKDEDYKTALKSYDNFKRKIQQDSTSLNFRPVALKARAADGKMRKADFVTTEQALRLIQEVPGKKSSIFKDWLAKVGTERIEETIDPSLGINRAEQRYVSVQLKRGMTQEQALQALQDRRDGKRDFRLLCAAIDAVCDAPQYGKVVNAEYMAMFGEIAANLREILETKSIRDALPPMQYSYIRSAELSLQELFRQQDRMTMPEILDAVDEIAVPLGKHLQTVCARLHISHITGQPLLERNN